MSTLRPDYRFIYADRQTEYRRRLQEEPRGLVCEAMHLLGREHRAIAVCPEAVHEATNERARRWLSEMGRRGYLCFFCDPEGEEDLREAEPNVFAIRDQGALLPALRSQAAIVLISRMTQMIWADLLPHKAVWYDMTDADLPVGPYDEAMLEKRRQVIASADIVTYSAQPLSAYLAGRPDALYLPSAEKTWSDLFDQVERQFAAAPAMWMAYANDRPAGKVAIMTTTFLDYDGDSFYSGGAERYLLDLHRLCRRIGLECVIYQYGNYPWRRRYQDIDVVSLSRGGQTAKYYNVPTVSMFSRLFAEQTDERAALTIYSAHFNAWPHGSRCPSIGIIHGVSWDGPNVRATNGNAFWERNRRFIEGVRLCDRLVSVDTNSANWFQTIQHDYGHSIQVIPNYVEESDFSPRDGYLETRERLVILYPRRLYSPRGLYMVLDVLDGILEAYPNVDFHFVGYGDSADTARVDEKRARWGNRIRRYSLPMKEMAQAYHAADITLIPTLHSEGTSLSCLEAMACGNAVIATRIGGLSDLVIHDYNGLLIEPNAEALKDAIRGLLDRPDKLAELKRKATEVARVFSKRRWEHKWTEVLQSALGDQPNRQPSAGSGRLVELYLSSELALDGRMGETIVRLLERGDLVYVRIQNDRSTRARSYGRLQWMDWRAIPFAEPDVVLADRSSVGDAPRPVDAIWNEEGEWEWTSSSRASLFGQDRRSSNESSILGEGH
ncbi:glycosyltransferase family 4 protein [Cohnella lubricantis]|uniref:Glycosyltransferase family 4 protein n=1 Tax=Cohnella lubricantis TaxID=2163172 RepID=A0A841T7U2_9BACL|nr:glycosyltransferase family 4 protein [Cohnella lubricantis]MBB6676126.1 glycosyltransferase family 4 protein [Cohnella lubricantis]MBP2118682.1 glycosyltransferase involved in cell wall biosynthesis [Cohnella lubricantis]